MRKKVYISGPISNGGQNDRNGQREHMKKAAFIAQDLIESGFAVFLPHLTVHLEELTQCPNPHEVWMENDLPWVLSADAVFRLQGESSGADVEVRIAKRAKIPVFEDLRHLRSYFQNPPKTPSPCMEAYDLVHGERGATYGHPWEDFSRTAKMWSVLFNAKIEPEDVAMGMICVKLSRLRNHPDHKDSVTDIAGYSETLAMVQDYRKFKAQSGQHTSTTSTSEARVS